MVSQRKGWKIHCRGDRYIEQNRETCRKEHSDTGKGNGWMTYKKQVFFCFLLLVLAITIL